MLARLFIAFLGLTLSALSQSAPQADAKPAAAAKPQGISFTNDILPLLSKAGCNAGGCHAKPEGQSNFKLSVFAYDPRGDYHEIVRDARGRRVFPAAPEQSLLLRKAIGAVPHDGGQRFTKDSATYKAVLAWMQAGMPFETEGEPQLQSIAVMPREQSYKRGASQALKVIARYSDSSSRDVTALADYLSQDKEMATVDEQGKITVGQRMGESIIVVRYMGMVDVARVTVPADKLLPASAYAALPVRNEIDRLVYAKLQALGYLPSEGCSDAEFLRRASLDAIGVLPSPQQARAFLASTAPDKRETLIDELLRDPRYADHWAVKWGDLIRPNPSRVGVKPVLLLDQWLRAAFLENKPYDRLVRELLTATGSTHEYGPVAMVRDKREPVDAAGFASQIYLGVRLECAKCHHHPSEKWSQEDYYSLAAFFGQMSRAGQGISAPISGEPEFWWYGGKGSVTHPVTDAVMVPKAPDGPPMPYVPGQDPRAALADWMTASSNPYFAKAFVNRLWSEFMGRGLVDPVDDFRVSNPPSNEPLLDWLAQDFAGHGFDLKHLMRTIMRSHTYQLSSRPNATNIADTKNYSRAYRRRLAGEVLLDAVSDITGQPDSFEGMAKGSRATQTWNVKLGSAFLDAFGRPNASLECPCERDRKSSVVQALHLMNSPALQEKMSADTSRLRTLAKSDLSEPRLVQELYLTIYNRTPQAQELSAALRYFATAGATRQTALEDIAWSLLNSAEFVFNH